MTLANEAKPAEQDHYDISLVDGKCFCFLSGGLKQDRLSSLTSPQVTTSLLR